MPLTRLLCRIYSVMLYAYPAEFRTRFGPEMAQLFRDRCRTESPRTLLPFLLQMCVDWLTTAIPERFHSTQTSTHHTLRLVLLLSIAASVTMIGIFALYHRLLSMPSGVAFVLQPVALLVIYAGLVTWATANGGEVRNAPFTVERPLASRAESYPSSALSLILEC